MLPSFPRNELSEIEQGGINNTQQVAMAIHNHYPTTPLDESKKEGILQTIIVNLIELVVPTTVDELDVQPYEIEKKIDFNNLTYYKEPFDFYMDNKQLIQYRLDHLVNNSDPLATEKLFKVIRLSYFKHLKCNDSNEIIRCMEDELSQSLLKIDPSNFENIMYIPSIIFYVFSECKIFKKPRS
ncbi:hypothetical protein [Acinetobacter pullicarnis]|uniref:hypothetical protein n=1 Tax=Acinetobacter pullicarnis TaxID=2576829 RepID=UPI0011228C74|nr:hypothetical protein [Acinetobacter pullicarnis]